MDDSEITVKTDLVGNPQMQRSWMSRLAVNEVSTYNWSFEEDVLRYHQQGFRSVGVWRYKLNEFGVQKAADMLQDCDMSVSSLHWAGGFTGGDDRSYSESLCDAFDAIEQAATLKAGCLVVLTGGRRCHTKNHLRRILKHALKEVSEAARAMNVQLAIEPMHVGCGGDWTFLNDFPETLDLVCSLGCNNVGIVFDTYHLGQSSDVVHWLPSIVPYIRLVQIADAKSAPLGEQNRCVPGDGMLPLAEIVQAFEASKYQGFYEIEVLGEEVEHMDYAAILENSASRMMQWLT